MKNLRKYLLYNIYLSIILAFLCFNALNAFAVVIDNGDNPETSFTGSWGNSSGADPYDGSSLWSRNGDTYTFTFTPTTTGDYDFSIWHTEWSSRSTSVPVEIENDGATANIIINQQVDGGQWNYKDTYHFTAATSYNVTITSQPGPSSTCADAVNFELVVAPGVETIIDNGDNPETSFTGSWGTSGASGSWDENSLWARNGNTYTWTFTPSTTGNHEVFEWHTEWPSRSTSVPVVIQNNGAPGNESINQQDNGGQWNSVGTYPYTAGEEYDVTITSQPGPSSTCADAFRFLYVGEPPNIPPVGLDDEFDIIQDLPVELDVLGNDDDDDGSINPATCTFVQGADNGDASFDAFTGILSYDPNDGWTGTEILTYTCEDFEGALSNVITVTINVFSNEPTAEDDDYLTAEDTTLVVSAAEGVLDNDSDPRDFSLDAILVDDVDVSEGTLSPSLGPDGSFTFIPAAGFSGSATFTYKATNGSDDSNIATVIIGVGNATPIANDDDAQTAEDVMVIIDLVTNDNDIDGSIVPDSCELGTPAANGTVIFNPDGTVDYIPDSGYSGTDTFTYTCEDDGGAVSNEATVTVQVGLVIDNGDPGTSGIGGWSTSSGLFPWDGSSLWNRGGGTYTFSFTPTMDGHQRLYMWWTDYYSRGEEILVEIESWHGTDTRTINQQVNGGQWNYMGRYAYEAGTTYEVRITSTDGDTACADAIQLVYDGGENVAPLATINSISPDPLVPGGEATCSGTGIDLEDTIVAAHSWYSTLDGPLSDQASFSTTGLSAGVHTIFYKVQDSDGLWSPEVQASIDVNDSSIHTIHHIFWAVMGYSPWHAKEEVIALMQDMGATNNGGGQWTYNNALRNKTYIVHIVETKEAYEDSLTVVIPGADEIMCAYSGHSNYGSGQYMCTDGELARTIIDGIEYTNDDRFTNICTETVRVSVSGMRTGQSYPDWTWFRQDESDARCGYYWGDPLGDPAYNYYVTYQVPGDPTHYKIDSPRHSAVRRFSDTSTPAWYDETGNGGVPDPSNPDHLQYYITNDDQMTWSPSVLVTGNWTSDYEAIRNDNEHLKVFNEEEYYRENYIYSSGGSGADQVEWKFTIPNSDVYRVSAQWRALSNNATNAPYTVYHSESSEGSIIPVNQRNNGGQFNLLGEWFFDATEHSVVLTDDATGGNVVADAIKVEHADNPPEIIQANFYAYDFIGPAPLEVSFRNDSTGDRTGRHWTFGDTFDNITRDSVEHIYTSPGTYTVSLEVTGPEGSDMITMPGYVTVTSGSGGPTLQAEFQASSQEGTAPDQVRFSDRSFGNIVSWSWDFGDPNDATPGTGRFPRHTYNFPGIYTVTLTVTDVDGNTDFITKEQIARTIVFEKILDNFQYPLNHYSNKLLIRPNVPGEIAVSPEDFTYDRFYYGGCDAAHYYTGVFGRGIMHYATGSSTRGEEGCSAYIRTYLEGGSDYEIWQAIQESEPLYDFYDFNKYPDEQW